MTTTRQAELVELIATAIYDHVPAHLSLAALAHTDTEDWAIAADTAAAAAAAAVLARYHLEPLDPTDTGSTHVSQ